MSDNTGQVAIYPSSLAYFTTALYSESMHFTQLQALLPQRLLCQVFGWLAERSNPLVSRPLIALFRIAYRIDMEEYVRTRSSEYKSFNDFFTRQIKSESRPICTHGIASPVDGRFSCLGLADKSTLLQAKGKKFSLQRLLANRSDPTSYEGSAYAIIYLAPTNYHRVHVPLESTLESLTYVPGKQFSVNATSSRHIADIYARNERLIAEFSSIHGKYCLIMVGALLVAGMSTVVTGAIRRLDEVTELSLPEEARTFSKGEEFGAFEMGSTVILLFEPQSVQWNKNAVEGKKVRLGEAIADCASHSSKIS